MYNNKCALFFAVGVLATLSCCGTTDITRAKLHDKFAELNEYLEKNVQSNDPQINMAKVKELSKEVVSKPDSKKSFVSALKLLIEYADVPTNEHSCARFRRENLSEFIDAGLADESRSKTPNYPLNRVDKIIEHYAFKDASLCEPGYFVPNMVYAFKQRAYDNVSIRLAEELPETDDVEANMAKAEEMLKGMPDGAMTDALRQLVQLKSTLSEDTCNQEGFEILFKNQLGTRNRVRRGDDNAFRRVEKIFKHFAVQHEQLCRPVVVRFVRSEIKKLDLETYRLVLGLVSAYYLDASKYAKLIEEVNEKEADDAYYTPLFVEYANEVLKNWPQDKEYIYPKQILDMDISMLWRYVKAASVNDPISKSFESAGKRRDLNHHELQVFLGKYLFEPCARFLDVFKNQIEADRYSVNINFNHHASRKDKFIEELTYHTIRRGVQACKFVYHEQNHIFQTIRNDISEKLSKK